MPEVMPAAGRETRRRYRPPEAVVRASINSLIEGVRTIPADQQARLPGIEDGLFCVGDRELAKHKSVAIVGSRKVSEQGAERARTLSKRLVERGFVVVSGLAYGVDVNAHEAAIEHGGKTIAVIGTPVDKAYPVAHAELQERIYRDHLLVSPFAKGTEVFPSNFPERNKVMAAISDATCIVEASNTSGSLHQARECVRLKRWLFIMANNLKSPTVTWPERFIHPANRSEAERVRVIESIEDITTVL